MANLCKCLQSMCKRLSCNAALFVRTFHTALSLGVPATLLARPSALHSAIVEGHNYIYGACYISLLAFSLLMYFMACFTDPGYVPIIAKKKKIKEESSDGESDLDTNEKSTMLDSKDDQTSTASVKPKQCQICNIEQPMRAKHCQDCKRCVCKWDHHCPWLEACVGERNHRYFWLFLFTKIIIIAWTVYIAWTAIIKEKTWFNWFQTNILYCIDLLILFLAGIPVFGLWLFHTYLMLSNITTWESVSRHRISYLKYLDRDLNPFNEGCCKNMYKFFCRCKVTQWARLYATKQTHKTSSVV